MMTSKTSKPIIQTCPEPIKRVVDPTTRLMWPELQDDHLENSRKVLFSFIVHMMEQCVLLYMRDLDEKTVCPFLKVDFMPLQVPLDRHDIIIDKVTTISQKVTTMSSS